MAPLKSRFRATLVSFKDVITKRPHLTVPFIILAFLDYAALTLIYLAPRDPLSKIMAPPIRKIWGEQYLHYPHNFSLIPKLFNYGHIFISFTFGLILSAVFIKLISFHFDPEKNIHQRPFMSSIAIAFKKYIPMVIFFGVFYLLTQMLFKITGMAVPLFVESGSLVSIISLCLNFIGSFLLQTLFVFMFPILIISDQGLIRTFIDNFKLVFSHYRPVFFLIALPSLLYLIVMLNMIFLPRLVQRFEPEIVLVSLGINIFLTVIIDFFITGFSAILYCHIVKTKGNNHEA